MKSTFFACCITASALAGCSTLPNAGPTTSEIMKQAAKRPANFDLVEVNQHVVSVLSASSAVGLPADLEAYGRPPSPTIERGDKVAVSIWRTQTTTDNPAGEPGAGLVIPDQTVGDDGGISVPYAGRIPAAGHTPLEVQREIEGRLVERVVKPQAIVSITHAVSNSVTIVGEQITGTRVPLSVGGDRLLDVIAEAGGTKLPVYGASVRLSRDGKTVTIPMSMLISDPRANIYAWPGDVISIVETPQKFIAFGATFENKLVPFESNRLDLAQAIAKAGGLLDLRSDPAGVFLLRFEPPAIVNDLGIPNLANGPRGDTPVLYHINLREVDGFFLTKRFPVANNDIVYVADARLTELEKVFTLVGTFTAPVTGGFVVYRSATH